MSLTVSPIQIVKSNPTTTANVSSLQRALFAASTRSEIEKINPNVMASLTSGQIASLSTTQQSYLTGAQLSKLSVEAWDGFKSTAVALFNDEQVRSLGKNFVLSGSNGKLACLPEDKLKMLSSEAVRSIQAKNIYRLSSAQLDAVINNNIRNTAGFPSELSAEAVSGIVSTNILGVSPDSIKLLNPNVISSLPLVVLNKFDDLQIKALTNTQVAKLSMRQVLTLSNAQKSAMSAYQLRSLSKEGWEGFTTTQVSEISAEKIPYLGTNFIKGINTYTYWMSNEQLIELSADAVKNISGQQILGLHNSQLNAILSNGRNSLTHPSELTAAAVSGIQSYQIEGAEYTGDPNPIAPLSQSFDALPADKFKFLHPSTIRSINSKAFSKLSSDQFSSLTSIQISQITPTQLSGVSSDLINNLSSEQIKSLNPESIINLTEAKIANLLPSVLAKLTNLQLKALTPQQVNAITPEQKLLLTTQQKANLKAPKASIIPIVDVTKLTTTQIKNLTPQDVNIMSADQISSLNTNQLKSFTKNQLAIIEYSQISSLSSPQLNALLMFI